VRVRARCACECEIERHNKRICECVSAKVTDINTGVTGALCNHIVRVCLFVRLPLRVSVRARLHV